MASTEAVRTGTSLFGLRPTSCDRRHDLVLARAREPVMALRLSGATSEDRETGERYAPNPHFETSQPCGHLSGVETPDIFGTAPVALV